MLPIEVFIPNWQTKHRAHGNNETNAGVTSHHAVGASPEIGRTTVVLEQNRVMAMSADAQAAGVQAGMRRGSVQMLLPDAHFYARDLIRENASLQTVAMALLQYSPQLVIAAPASILINVGASLRLFGGIRHLCKKVLQTIAAMGMSVTLGCAVTAQGAWLLAQAAFIRQRRARYCLSLRRLPHHLDKLPVELLPAAAPWLAWLQGIGCQQLAALRQLPRAGLQRRCGKTMLTALDCAYGDTDELYQWLEVPSQFSARTELPDRIEHAESILNFARILLLQLCGWLSKQQLATTKIQFQLEHERGRLAIAPTRLEISLAEATWHEEYLSRLVREHLGQLLLDAPVIALSLQATELEAMQAPSASLFPEPGGTREEHHRLLELLVARLGADQVLQAAPLADYRPEVANNWVSVMHTRKLATLPEQASNMMNRPAWLLAQPLPLEVRQHRPCYNSPLRLVSPAERIEAGWWNGQLVTRDYFVAENTAHLRCWIYRERISPSMQQADTDKDARWYLHGIFG